MHTNNSFNNQHLQNSLSSTPLNRKLSRQLESYLLDKSIMEGLILFADTVRAIDPMGFYTQWILQKGDRLVTPTPSDPFAWLGVDDCDGSRDVVTILKSIHCVQSLKGEKWLFAEPSVLHWDLLLALIGWCMQRKLRMDICGMTGQWPGYTLGIRISMNTNPSSMELEIQEAVQRDKTKAAIRRRRPSRER